MSKPLFEYPRIVREIHHAFNTAGEELLADVKEFLTGLDESYFEKASRLQSVGFINTDQARSAKEKTDQKEKAVALANLVNEYSIKYPNNKFITEEMVETLCLRYNLVCGDVSLYKGFVPEKNLAEIEAFFKTYNLNKVALFECEDSFLSLQTSHSEIINLSKYNHITTKADVNGWFELNGKLIFQYSDNSERYLGTIKCSDGVSRTGWLTMIPAQICAPIKDMDTSNMDLVGYRLKKHIPDPVVLQPINGGYLIVTAWGDEASDEIVVNPKHN